MLSEDQDVYVKLMYVAQWGGEPSELEMIDPKVLTSHGLSCSVRQEPKTVKLIQLRSRGISRHRIVEGRLGRALANAWQQVFRDKSSTSLNVNPTPKP